MEHLTFDVIHKTSLAFVNSGKTTIPEKSFYLIGNWLYKSLKAPRIPEEIDLIIPIPGIDDNKLCEIVNYIFMVDLLKSLPETLDDQEQDEVYLFDLFSYRTATQSEKESSSFFRKLQKKEKGLLFFNDDIVVKENRFIPLFYFDNNEPPEGLNQIIFQSFKILVHIEKFEIINYPVLFNPKNITTLFLIQDDLKIPKWFLTRPFLMDKKIKKNVIDRKVKFWSGKPFKKQYFFFLNNKSGFSTRLIIPQIQKLNIILKKEFNCKPDKIENKEIYFAPGEFAGKNIEAPMENNPINVIKTTGNAKLFKSLKKLYNDWIDERIDGKTNPFPIYWFYYLNKGVEKKQWIEKYKKQYPAISISTLFHRVEELFNLLYDLNWLEDYLRSLKTVNSFNVLIPKTRHYNQSQKYNEVIEPLTDRIDRHMSGYLERIDEINSFDYNDCERLVILDPLNNLTTLTNILEVSDQISISVPIPDFLYFLYREKRKVSLAKNILLPRYQGAKKVIDPNYALEQEEKSKEILIKLRVLEKDAYKDFLKRIEFMEEQDDLNDLGLELIGQHWNEVTEIDPEEDDGSETYNIELNDNKTLKNISSNTNVFLIGDSLQRTTIASLKIEDKFIFEYEINSVINDDAFLEKLSELPKIVQHYQYTLFKKKQKQHLFYELRRRGLSISGKDYFYKTYTIENKRHLRTKFGLPLRKTDWDIICDFLGISSTDKTKAWVTVKGRLLEKLYKRVYRMVFAYALVKNITSFERTQEIENDLRKIIRELKDNMKDDAREFDEIDFANSILDSILNNLEFHKVSKINCNGPLNRRTKL